METENLKRKIIETVAFFDLFNYPMTSFEVWKFGSWERAVGLFEVSEALDGLKAAGLVEMHDGFFFLPGRESLVDTRKERYNLTDRKMERAVKVAKLFKVIPWIRLVAIGNLIGSHNMREDGDIDFFIVSAKNRLWLTRFFSVLLTKFLGLRPTSKNNRDTVCLSFYVSEDALDLGRYRLESDIYFRHWLAGLYPIFDAGDVYHNLIARNAWLKDELPNWQPNKTVYRRDAGRPWPFWYRPTVDFFLGWLERPLKKIQLKMLPQALRALMNQDTRVVVNDQVLKLHSNDRREEYAKNHKARIMSVQSRIASAGN